MLKAVLTATIGRIGAGTEELRASPAKVPMLRRNLSLAMQEGHLDFVFQTKDNSMSLDSLMLHIAGRLWIE